MEIPRQSAAISFAYGKETLTILNTVEAKGQDLAWAASGLLLLLSAAGWTWSQVPKDVVIVETAS